MAVQYSVTTGLTAIAAATTRTAISLASGATVSAAVISFDVSFDGDASSGSAAIIPCRVQLVRTSTVSSTTGAAYTPVPWNKALKAAEVTARINDTAPGTVVSVIKEWLVSPTAGFSYQFALGREIDLSQSDFLELKLDSQTGMTTCNYICNLDFEE